MRLPDFVVIGAMKCATTTLHDQLAVQPGFFMSTPKEPNFFSDDDVYARGLDWYAGLFRAAGAHELCGESSTHYTKLPTHPHALERMRAVLPRAKLIYVMRHPIDRLVSHYVHEWTENRLKGSIDQAVARYPALVDYSRYGMQLEPYLHAYGPENILPVFLERMTRYPQETLERIARFLGRAQELRWQEGLEARNVGAERLRKSWLRGVADLPPLAALRRRFVPQTWRDWVKRLLQMRHKPAPSAATLERLRDVFDADLDRLGRWLGAPLSCDRFRESVLAAPLDWTDRRPAGSQPQLDNVS